MSNNHKFPYRWTLADAVFTKDKGKVFSCFSCGGGSTMGYKLAGFDVLGCNEIDPKMMDCYIANHKPKYAFLEAIQTFKLRKDLPAELYNLDILDGSPPCSSFSTGGNREKDWGKEKKFKEGQVKQVLDTLFFDFIDLAAALRPKVVIAENVEGLINSNALYYMKRIYKEFDSAGYYLQHYLLDGSHMGIPQDRKRVFFLAIRKDLATPFLEQKDMFSVNAKINMKFSERRIFFGEIEENDNNRKPLRESYMKYYNNTNRFGVYDQRAKGGSKFGFYRKAMRNRPLATIMGGNAFTIEDKPEMLNKTEFCLAQSYPLDYDFLDNEPQYLIGMSVAPVMMAQISTRVYDQWLSKINV